MFDDFLFRRRRHKYTKFDFYIFIAILYAAVIIEKPANMWLYLFLLTAAVACIIYIEMAKKNHANQDSEEYFENKKINLPKEFVKDKNTLGNIHCVAKYFPSQNKIVVMDHPDSRVKTELRKFEVSKENVGNVVKVWNDICSVFDEYTFFDTLFSYVDKNSGILKLTFIYRAEKAQKYEENISHDFKAPEPVYDAKALVLSEYGDPLINIDNLEKKCSSKSDNSDNYNEYNEFIEMSDILKPEGGKIDVNVTNAEKLSELPGINIVKAKKIVEYRDKNGFFKTKEDFYKIAGVKEHFIPQIDKIITVDKSSRAIVEDPRRKSSNERIVD